MLRYVMQHLREDPTPREDQNVHVNQYPWRSTILCSLTRILFASAVDAKGIWRRTALRAYQISRLRNDPNDLHYPTCHDDRLRGRHVNSTTSFSQDRQMILPRRHIRRKTDDGALTTFSTKEDYDHEQYGACDDIYQRSYIFTSLEVSTRHRSDT